MRYIGEHIEHVRAMVDQSNASTTRGIGANEILQYFNDGQWELQAEIFSKVPDFNYWDFEKTITVSASSRAYDFGSLFMFGSGVRMVEYSCDGTDSNYYDLELTSLKNIAKGNVSSPGKYAIRGRNIVTGLISDGGTLRVTGPRRAIRVDTRRGKVSSTANDGTDYTSITLASDSTLTSDNQSTNPTLLARYEYVTVVDKHGEIQYSAIPVASFSSPTLTLDDGVLLTSGTISANDYVVLGDYSTTHLDWPEEVESEIMSWVAWKIKVREESLSSQDYLTELSNHASKIISRVGNAYLDDYRWA